LYVVFAAAILGLMFAPRRWPVPVFALLFGVAFSAGLGYTWLERTENQRSRNEGARWLVRYDAIRDAHDVADDGHLYDSLDSAEWDRVFSLVEQMPPGARSLKRAIKEVDPTFEE
jgi:hypothetical protein